MRAPKAENPRGVGGMLPQKILKPRGSEVLFSALFMRYFFNNLLSEIIWPFCLLFLGLIFHDQIPNIF